MRFVAAVLLAVSPALMAQRQVSPSGYGRILFPGGQPTAGGTVSGGGGRIAFPGGGAPFVSRQGPIGSVWTTAPLNPPRQDHDHDRRRGGVVAVPVPVPVYYNTGYYDYDPPPAQVVYPVPATPVAPYTAPEYRQQEPPVVIINQYFRGEEPPVTQTQPQASVQTPNPQPAPALTAPSAAEETVFLIAMKDHNVYTARAYWIEDGMLNYISTDGVESSVNLADVDRDLSRRLNRDRNVAFGLPVN